MSNKRHHADWLSLVEVSGPFVSTMVLEKVFPQGLDAHDPEHARSLRLAYDEWEDNQSGNRPTTAIHNAWIRFILNETLGFTDEVFAEGQAIPAGLKATIAEHGETLRPDFAVRNPEGVADAGKPRVLIQTYPGEQPLEKPIAGRHWKASPATRMMELLHATDVRLGLVTNGDQWMLVDAPRGETTGFASWFAWLWFEQSDKGFSYFRSFRSLLCARRFFGVADEETLEAILAESATHQQEVTDQLGLQVRRAVEVLIQSLDRADQDDKVLAGVPEPILYEAALTVMMRLVFLFSAEERGLLLLGDPLYDEHYAVSTLVAQLQEAADQHGEEVLERRPDAWVRLLSTFRAVFGGVQHERMKLPAYAGNLFDPDRFPFLEGHKAGTTWRDAPAMPLPVNNRTVLHLLRSLQYLELQGEARRLSFRALDIEQIGHVYEGLLDHTAKRATEPVLGLAGAKRREPEVPLANLERHRAKGEDDLVALVVEETGRSESAVRRALTTALVKEEANKVLAACGHDDALFRRVLPFGGLIRNDTFDRPVVIRKGSVFVTGGTDRRASGTHYTPRSLTEPIVQYTLEPLVYVGPAEGLPKEQWKLRSAKELLDLKICDMACGSGAFLVQACRYMAARLLEAWDTVQRANPGTVRITPEGQPSTGKPGEMLIPDDPDERQTYALRIVAQRCLYGVDKNPLAAEMAKLSLWLLTLAKDKPFEFLDHAIRCGDSLVGIHNTEQLRKFNLDGKGEDNRLFLHFLNEKIKDAIALRRQITEMQANTVEDVEAQDRMLREANEKINQLKCAADMLISAEFVPGSAADKRSARDDAAIKVAVHFQDSDLATFRREAQESLGGQVTFHWPLEFPEVMVECGGFDAFVGNPPFMGGSRISNSFGSVYRDYLVDNVAHGEKGRADLCAYFVLRATSLLLSGSLGMIATNSIAEGDTRDVGLLQLKKEGITINRAVSALPWPGTAALTVSLLWLHVGTWRGETILDSVQVDEIDDSLSEAFAEHWPPFPLIVNTGKSLSGSYVYGQGFVLTPSEAQALLEKNSRNKEVVFPYLIGDSFLDSPTQSPDRYVINFFDWPLDRSKRSDASHLPAAVDFPDCLEIVRQKVKPERDALKEERTRLHWWQYARRAVDLYEAIKGLRRVLFHAFTSKHLCFGFVDSGIVFAQPHIVFAYDLDCYFSVLQSSIHYSWVLTRCSKMETRIRYVSSDLFDTFPLPLESSLRSNGSDIGAEYHRTRADMMACRNEGLTATYNRFHDPDDTSADIQKLRHLHVEMDYTVAAAYGWTDLDLGHGFHETKQGVRYTICEPARREVLQRLLKLNHERYSEEVGRGLHDKKRGTSGGKREMKRRRRINDKDKTLFSAEEGAR